MSKAVEEDSSNMTTEVKVGSLIANYILYGDFPESLQDIGPIEILKALYKKEHKSKNFEKAISNLLKKFKLKNSIKKIADIFGDLNIYVSGKKYDEIGWAGIRRNLEGILAVFAVPKKLRDKVYKEVEKRIFVGDLGFRYMLDFKYIKTVKFCNQILLPELHRIGLTLTSGIDQIIEQDTKYFEQDTKYFYYTSRFNDFQEYFKGLLENIKDLFIKFINERNE